MKTKRGVTLVELLVVVSILTLLAAVTVPLIRTGTERRRVRESARMVESYLANARITAQTTKREVGVQFVRWPEQSEVSVQLRRVEVPPIYVGADDSARFTVRSTGGYGIELVSSPNAIHVEILPGDECQLGLLGWRSGELCYRLDAVSTDGSTGITTAQATLVTTRNGSIVLAPLSLPWPTGSQSQPQFFAIKRQPIPTSLSSAVEPILLPARTCVDLYESGTDQRLFIGTDPVTLLFNARGGVDRVLGIASISPVDDIHFLVCHLDRTPVAATNPRGEPATDQPDPQAVDVDPGNSSWRLRAWRDGDSLWVSLNPKSGRTATAEVATVDQTQLPSTITPPYPFNYAATDSAGQRTHLLWGLRVSRRIVKAAEPISGR